MNEKTDMRMRNQEQGNSKARGMGLEYSSERREVAHSLNGSLRWVESIGERAG